MTFLEAHGDLVGAVLIAALLIGAFGKPTKQMIGGWLVRGKKGELLLKVTPTPKPKRRHRRRK